MTLKMQQENITDIPKIYPEIQRKSEEIGFSMSSDLLIGSLLKTLISSKPGAQVLELGTGIGLALSWMIEGMDTDAHLTTVDNDSELIAIAKQYFGHDERLTIVCDDGAAWLKANRDVKFDLVFADAWPGKYSEIETVLEMINPGGFYVIDDMTAQPNWPEGHHKNVDRLVRYLEDRTDFSLTKMNWSTGIIIAVRK